MKRPISTSPLPHLTRLVWLDATLANLLENHLPEHGSMEILVVAGKVQREARIHRTILVPKEQQDTK